VTLEPPPTAGKNGAKARLRYAFVFVSGQECYLRMLHHRSKLRYWATREQMQSGGTRMSLMQTFQQDLHQQS
jgi:hypothetical protein